MTWLIDQLKFGYCKSENPNNYNSNERLNLSILVCPNGDVFRNRASKVLTNSTTLMRTSSEAVLFLAFSLGRIAFCHVGLQSFIYPPTRNYTYFISLNTIKLNFYQNKKPKQLYESFHFNINWFVSVRKLLK